MLQKKLIYLQIKLLDLINISKVFHNYMSRCKYTGEDSKGGIGLVGGHQFFSEKHC